MNQPGLQRDLLAQGSSARAGLIPGAGAVPPPALSLQGWGNARGWGEEWSRPRAAKSPFGAEGSALGQPGKGGMGRGWMGRAPLAASRLLICSLTVG